MKCLYSRNIVLISNLSFCVRVFNSILFSPFCRQLFNPIHIQTSREQISQCPINYLKPDKAFFGTGFYTFSVGKGDNTSCSCKPILKFSIGVGAEFWALLLIYWHLNTPSDPHKYKIWETSFSIKSSIKSLKIHYGLWFVSLIQFLNSK